MPNDCWNKITIKANYEQIKQIMTTEFIDIKVNDFQHFLQGKEVYICRIRSDNIPNKEIMTRLFEKYEGIWIKNIWQEEAGLCGIIVGTKDNVKEIEWDEGCEEEWHLRLEEADLPEVVLANEEDE
jgi:hypothetical protein